MYAIEIDDLWKRYYLYGEKNNTLKSAVLNRFQHLATRKEFWALQGVSLRIGRGQTVGIIGNNGAGKSTLLRLLSGLGRPTRGRVHYSGRVSTLLELGTGFSPDFSGRANVYTSGIVSGLTRREVADRFDNIVDFAELRDFIDAPVRTYSSGMFVRLAFATAINLDPDVVVVDEVLAVGDIRFQQKCLNRLREFKEAGKTIVLVSHAMGQIEDLCDEVIWLDAGKVRAHGLTADVIGQYRERVFMAKPMATATATAEPVLAGHIAGTVTGSDADKGTAPRAAHRTGQIQCALTDVSLYDERGRATADITSGDALVVGVSYQARQTLRRPIFSVGIFRDDGTKCYEAVTESDGLYLEEVRGAGALTVSFSDLNLMSGSYYIDAGVYAHDWEQAYDYRHKAASFAVNGFTPGSGVFMAPHQWSVV